MQNFYLDFIIGLINESEILKSAKDAYHKFMWIFIFKIYCNSNIVAQVNSEFLKYHVQIQKNFQGDPRDILVCLGGPRHLICIKFYYVNLRN